MDGGKKNNQAQIEEEVTVGGMIHLVECPHEKQHIDFRGVQLWFTYTKCRCGSQSHSTISFAYVSPRCSVCDGFSIIDTFFKD